MESFKIVLFKEHWKIIHISGQEEWGYVDNVDKSVDISETGVDKWKRDFGMWISEFLLYTWQKAWKNKDFLSNKVKYKQGFRKLSTNCQQFVDKIT